ncbi:Crp/Fnr family transcriptional regulator [Euhalothece natronophila Z-M001]|uniref:Crp/Fnr family transcriptional regulator n=1 Tax=Euhalothece natronophila Z-M001 TaxID=522448 RepID=A0A5B8NPR6_9CHRO|nr:Crp/Fnr family transcriptional regulator [Euhalothece natronophila]QDZ40180.1 Crp/Fnr family transcriptional regulator [Euhalothece natronophila Z-M001]
MSNSNLQLSTIDRFAVHTFSRRDKIPCNPNILWKIEEGAVRSFALSENRSIIPLGFWGKRDVIGQPLTYVQPCYLECLTETKVMSIESNQYWEIEPIMLAHIQQMQELLRIRHGQIRRRLECFLNWLGYKFGCLYDQKVIIELRLTHREIAEAIGTTRVTATRVLQELEEESLISYSPHNYLVLHRFSPFRCH